MLLTSCSGGEGDVDNPSYVGNMGLTDIPKEIITQNLSADHEGKKADKESPTKVFTNEFSDTSIYSIYSDAYFGDGLNSGNVLGTYDQSKGEPFNVVGSIKECVYQLTKVEDEENGVYEYTFFDTYGEKLYSYLSTDGISVMHHGANHNYNRRGFSVFYETDPDTGAMEYTALTYLGYNDFTPVSFE